MAWAMVVGPRVVGHSSAEALEREPHTIGNWLDNFRQGGAQGLVFEQTGGSPPS